MNRKIEELQNKLRIAIRQRDFVKMKRLQNKIDNEINRTERVPLNTMFDEKNVEIKEAIIKQMHRMFVYADLLYGAAIDFESDVRKLDDSARLIVARQARDAANMAREITSNVDEVGNMSLSSDFGEMCDEIEKLVKNKIDKYLRR